MLYAERALKLGARGYVMKDRPTTEVLIAMRTVLAGGLYVSPSVSALALNNLIGQSAGNLPHSCHNLSNRELQVLQLLGAGLGTRKISSRLGLSVKTIEAHRENIKHKLGLGCAAELVRYAVDWVNGTASQHSAQSSPMQQNLGV
jgi:DNA-binding NarL/FixJ family response regulator